MPDTILHHNIDNDSLFKIKNNNKQTLQTTKSDSVIALSYIKQ